MSASDQIEPAKARAAWATTEGHLDFGAGAPADISSLADRLAILDVVQRYGWTYDERRLDVMQELYSEDTVFHGAIWGQPLIEPAVGIEAVLSWQRGWMDQQSDQRRHLITNLLVEEQQSDRAIVLAYMTITSADPTSVQLVATGFYRFTLVRAAGRWLIQDTFAAFDVPF